MAAGLCSYSEACVLASARAGRALARGSCGSPKLASTDVTTWQQGSMACGEFFATSPSFGTSNLKGTTWAIGCGVVALVVPFLKQAW